MIRYFKTHWLFIKYMGQLVALAKKMNPHMMYWEGAKFTYNPITQKMRFAGSPAYTLVFDLKERKAIIYNHDGDGCSYDPDHYFDLHFAGPAVWAKKTGVSM